MEAAKSWCIGDSKFFETNLPKVSSLACIIRKPEEVALHAWSSSLGSGPWHAPRAVKDSLKGTLGQTSRNREGKLELAPGLLLTTSRGVLLDEHPGPKTFGNRFLSNIKLEFFFYGYPTTTQLNNSFHNHKYS